MTNDTKKAPEHGHRFAVFSATGVHVGLWHDAKIAADVLSEYPGGYIEELVTLPEALATQGALIERAADVMKGVTKPKIPPLNMSTKEAEAFDEGQEGAILAMQDRIRALDTDATAALEAMRREAVEQERERCARIARSHRGKDYGAELSAEAGDGYDLACEDIAAAIRDTPPQET